MNLQASAVGVINKTFIGERYRALLEWYLRSKGAIEWFDHSNPTPHTE
jgi:hypothetical protein